MDADDYDKELRKLLGVSGPVGELRQEDGRFKLIYKMPDGQKKYLSPPQDLTSEQMEAVLKELRAHLEKIERNRNA